MRVQLPVKDQRGFSLIELMIALVLGLIIVGGVMVVFVSSSHSFVFNTALSRVQENGRFALEIVARELRNAGYRGDCFRNIDNLLDTGSANYQAAAYDLNDPLRGWGDGAGQFFTDNLTGYRPGTDLLLVKHAAVPSTAVLSANVDTGATSFLITGGERAGALLVFSDAGGCDLFQNTAGTNTNDLQRGATGQSLNNLSATTQPLSHVYYAGDMTRITRYSSTLFYVGASDRVANISALRGLSFNNGVANDQELVEGITEMSVLYALRPAAGAALSYTRTAAQVTAAGQWDDVVSVRVNMTVQGEQDLSYQFATTVALRNRLL